MEPAKKILFLLLFSAAAALPALAQPDQAGQELRQEQAGGRQPLRGAQPEYNTDMVELVRLPDGTAAFVYKHRWKDWAERSVYVCLAALALLGFTALLSRRDEQSLRLSYFLEGINFMMGAWVISCGAKLLMLKSVYGFYALTAGLLLFAAAYYLLMKIKAADISLAEVRASFLQQPAPMPGEGQDQRLASVDGTPGNWPDRDIIR